MKNPFFENIIYFVFETKIIISDDCSTENFEIINLDRKIHGLFAIKFNSDLKKSFIVHEKASQFFFIFSQFDKIFFQINEGLAYLDWLYNKENLLISAPSHRLIAFKETILSISDDFGINWTILSSEVIKY